MDEPLEQIDIAELQNKANSEVFISASFHYLRYFYNVGFYSLMIPFRILDRNGKYYFHVNKFQQGATLFLMILAVILGISSLHSYYFINIKEDPDTLFKVGLVLSNVGILFSALYVLWFKRDSVSNILSICQNHYKSTSPAFSWKGQFVVAIFCVFGIFQPLWQSHKNSLLKNFTLWEEIRNETSSLKFNFFFSKNLTSVTDEDMFTPGYFTLIILTHILHIYWNCVNSFMFLLVLFSSIVVFVISNDFHSYLRKLEQENNSNQTKILKMSTYFRHICDLISAINEMAGPVLIVLILKTVPFFAINVITFFDSSFGSRLTIAIFVLYYYLILILAAEGNSQLKQFKSKLFYLGRAIEDESMRQKIIYLVLEASEQDLGLNGGGYFLVTYEFVGAVTSLFITYATIMVQFK